MTKKYLLGHKIVTQKRAKDRLNDTVLRTKYACTQAIESEHFHSEMMFWKENRNLESYFWKQKVNYAKDLETRAAKIE